MRSSIRVFAALFVLLCWGTGHPAGAQLEAFGSAQLLIQGNRLTLFADELTTDAEQTINVAEPARVRTCFGGPEVPCGALAAGDPRIAGLQVLAELRGPELPQAVPLETVPGGTFLLPGFQQEGDYFLENIRLVSIASGQTLGFAEPPVAVLHVRQIVLASATVRQLSLADLEARGISLSEENFQAFNFAVGFAFADEIVEIEFPVLFEGNGTAKPLVKPRVSLENLPPDVVSVVRRWEPPSIVPFKLEATERELLRATDEEKQDLAFPLFGAIVVPGTVTFLNQFFGAQLIVANGAPAGSGVSLENLYGAVKLPSGNVLRLAATDPPVGVGQQVPVVGAGGGRVLQAGEQGTAEWTVEGLVPGTHTLTIDITGDIARAGRDPFPVLSRAQAAVEVVDARFNLTFTHPDVVREGEAYSLFVTVTNLSRATQNLITVDIREESLTGAHKEDPQDDLRRTIETLEPGQGETLEYRLVAELTGKVVATTFQSTSPAGQGTIELVTGVGELGIPLSPATLVLPRFSERLGTPYVATDELLRANARVLGLAYSLAVAPGRSPDLPRVIKSDVERRAVDLAEAGQRTFLHEELLESLEVLALDQLGNRHHLAEYDELRRRLVKGLRAAGELAAFFRAEQASRGLDALDFFDHFAETTSYARPYLAVTVAPSGAGPAPALEVRRLTETGLGVLRGTADDEDGAVRSLPWGEIYALHETAAGGDAVPFAVVGHLEGGEEYDLVLVNDSASTTAGRLVAVVPDGAGGDYRRLDFGPISVPPLAAVAVRLGPDLPDPTAGSFFDPSSGTPLSGFAAPGRSTVPLPPFRLIGAVQDFRMAEEGPDAFGNLIRPNRYGNGVSYLFNRPPDLAAAETAGSYRIRSTFHGLDTAGETVDRVSEKVGTAAFYQTNSERVVNVRYSTGLSALVDVDGTPLLDHEHLLDTAALVDERGNPLSPAVPAPTIEQVPLHVGGLVDGRVLRGTGEGVAGAEITLIRPRAIETIIGTQVKLDIAGTTTTDADGFFYFDYIENPNWDRQVLRNFILRATVPPGDDPDLEPGDVQEVSTFIRLQNRLTHVNIALLGRGTVTGSLVYLDTQEPVPEGRVMAASTLFGESKSVEVEGDGSFRLAGLPVGPITLTGSDRAGRRVFATVGIEEPGDVVDVRLEIQREGPPPGLGTVQGKVLRRVDGGALAAVPEARVAVYSSGNIVNSRLTDEFGNFRFDRVPEGQVSVQAADFRISRTPVFVDLILTAGATEEVELVIPDTETRAVSGRVEFHDPLTNSLIPVAGAVAFIPGPGVFAHTDADGRYRIEGLPVQGSADGAYSVTAIDFERQLQGSVGLPPVLETSPDEILAQSIVLESMVGGVDGVVLDPLGRPVAGSGVTLFPYAEVGTVSGGSFSFDGIPVGDWSVVAHVGDGLTPGRVGYFGQAPARIVFGGHRPFVTVRMRGSGVVNVHTRTATSTGILTPIYYRPTYYSLAAKQITLRGQYIETTTDPNGMLQLILPVGRFELVAFNPFHGIKEIRGEVEFPGQVLDLDILFEDAAIVRGQVVDVDGVTPVVGVPVTLHTKTLKPQTLTTDAQGFYQFELVPMGGVSVTAAGLVGTVERVGRADGIVTIGGQELELTVRMKAQGTVRGRVMERVGTDLVPLAHAQYFLKENSYPYRRLPEIGGTFFTTDAEGRYEVSHVYAGRVTVVARDSLQVTRSGSVSGAITADWQVVDLPDVVMSTSVGNLAVTIRDPESGGPVADAQVRLSNGEVTVSDAEGRALFLALPLNTYSVYAFYAPTGQSGRVGSLRLDVAGEQLNVTVFLDQRGEVRGTLFDDDALTAPVAGGTIRLAGSTTGGPLTALATTSGAAETFGRFLFLGIPEGDFSLSAGVNGSPRRAAAQVSLTETAPIADVNMVLEPVGDLYVRLYEKLTAGTLPVDHESGQFSLRLTQPSSSPPAHSYDFTRLGPEAGTDVYFYPDVLTGRSVTLSAQELGAEQRSKTATISDLSAPGPLPGSGTFADPYQMVLGPKGVVRVEVRDAGGALVPGANVTLRSSGGGNFPSVTGADGAVVFTAVPAGALTATSTSPITGFGGLTRGTLTFDDEVVELAIVLAPAVAAHGQVFEPLPDDRFDGDPSSLVPAVGAIVEIRDAGGDQQLVTTGADGGYRFAALAVGGFSLSARNVNGDQLANLSGALSGPDGNDNLLASLILDASPPRILSIVPPPGLEGVSRTAPVEIVFSEPLASSVVPTGQSTSNYFQLRSASGSLATGTWDSAVSAAGEQVVRFVPGQPYDNLSVYSLTIQGGANGVRDRIGRPLTQFGDVGSNFKTSDSIGPAVIATVPSLDAPVDPLASIRVDFNEAVVATAEQLDGDGVGDAAELSAEKSDGTFVRLPVTTFLTRGDFSLQVAPVQGLEIPDDTLRRRLVVSGLVDVFGNLMPPYEKLFRVFDDNAPVLVEVPFPAEAPDGRLSQGVAYSLTPVLAGLDDVTPENPAGDLARVEYFFRDPEDPTNPQTPDYAALELPFSYPFIAAYAGNGTDPRPFPVWVRAVDTSTNESNVVLVDMEVLPNRAPTVDAVAVEALAPAAGVFYAGSQIRATVSGLDDEDGNQLTLSAELRREGASEPLDAIPGRLVQRPPTGWADAAPESFDFTLPIELPEGTPLFVRARVIDSQGAGDSAESERFPVADDQGEPAIESLTARRGDGGADLLFFIGERLYVELRASDAETAVASVEVAFDRTDVLPSPQTATLVPGTDDLYRTAELSVPPDVFTAATAVVVTASADDFGANTGQRTLTIEVAPEPDPTAPTADWLTPWQGAPWPAGYTSVTAPLAGVPLLLRAAVADTNLDAGGNEVPGTLVLVEIKGPVAGAGGIELAADWTAAEKVAGTGGADRGVYQLLWPMPNQVPAGAELPFAVRAVDSGGKEAVRTVTMTAVAPRKVYESVITAVTESEPMLDPAGDPGGPVFLLHGTTLSVFPQSDGALRRLPAVVLLAGGEIDGSGQLVVAPSVLTAPEITSYSSAILFHPLELEIDQLFAVGAAARVDMTARGLLGSTSTQSLVLPGETGAEALAGGSHGGRGWYGSPAAGWSRDDLTRPGSVYDSLRDPRLPGGGGAAAGSQPGGAGGGVVRILAPMATVRLVGDVSARGGSGSGGGGAGGAIRLVAGRLEGRGAIDAGGGAGTNAAKTGGGGGGRVALTWRELGPGVDLAAQIGVAGGHNQASDPAAAQRLAGAGTVYLERIDPLTGAAAAAGELRVANASGLPAAITPLPALGDGEVFAVDPASATVTLDVPRVRGDLAGEILVLESDSGAALGVFPILAQEQAGGRVRLALDALEDDLAGVASQLGAGPVLFHGRARLAAVAASGAARLVADDDLEIGPEGAAALNDRSRLTLDAEARALLRGEAPALAATATPAGGADVRLGSTVEISWTADDPLGFAAASESFSLDAAPTGRVFVTEPLAITGASDPTLVTIPVTTPPGAVTYTIEARDLADREAAATLEWNVLENAQPTGFVAIAGGGPATVDAGASVAVAVHAEDPEGLAEVTLVAGGPANEPTQTVAASGTAQDLVFEISVGADATGEVPVVVEAVITDIVGASVTTASLAITVVPNDAPTGSVSVADGASAAIKPGDSTTVVVHAEDPDGLSSIELRAAGPVTEPVQAAAVTGTVEDVTFTLTARIDAEPGPLPVTAVATDRFGLAFETAPLELAIIRNALPTGTAVFATGTPAEVFPGEMVTVQVHAEDEEDLAEIVLVADGPVITPSQSLAVTGTAADADFEVTLERTALASETVDIHAEILDAFGNPATVTDTLVLGIKADLQAPQVTVTGVQPRYAAGQTLEATIETADEVGASRLDVTFDGATATVDDPGPLYVYTLEVDRTIAVQRTTAFQVVAVDFHGNASAPVAVPVELVPDQPPAVTTDVRSATSLLPGATIDVAVTAADDVTVETVTFTLNGALADSSVRQAGTRDAFEVYRKTLPVDLPGGSQLQLAVAVEDSFGHVVTDSVTFTVVADVTEPAVTIELSPEAPDDVYVSGDAVTVIASAEDDVAVAGLTLTVDGETVAGASPQVFLWTVPTVTAPTPVDITAEATDPAGNTGTLTRTVTVAPLDNGGVPTVRFDCPTTGAYLPTGYEVALAVTAADDLGVARVDFYRGDETVPFASATPEFGATTPFVASALDFLPALDGDVTYRAVAVDASTNSSAASIDVHAVTTVDLDPAGANDWTALAGQFAVLRSGTLTIDEPRVLGGLIVLPGATITHSASAPGAENALDLTVGSAVYVACGGAVDATGRGYPQNATYPGEAAASSGAGGSHIGTGGNNPSGQGTTYGSVYRPREVGAGGGSSAGDRGGGAVRLETAGALVVDGAVRANGAVAGSCCRRAGAGGSVWIVAASASGGGVIEARGGNGKDGSGSGGGGAVALELEQPLGGLRSRTSAAGGQTSAKGGAGTVLVVEPGSLYGDLTVANGDGAGRWTELPALGSGTAQASSGGALLATDLADVPAYFEGHWVEIYDGASGAFEGSGRIVSVDGSLLTLEPPPGGDLLAVDPGDFWQGAYYFDDLAISGDVLLESGDPIRVTGSFEIDGDAVMHEITGVDLVLRRGATLTHPTASSTTAAERLVIDLAGELTLEPDARIDVSGRGFARDQTYPGAALAPSNNAGGSHLGLGGNAAADLGVAYGSVYRPREHGSGGRSSAGDRGGGVVRIQAASLRLLGTTSAIRANGVVAGSCCRRAGAGGSVWITVGALSGDGTIEALGGNGKDGSGSGGGGAVAVEYAASSGTVLANARAFGGSTSVAGGAGTVYLFGPASVYGDLVVANGAAGGTATELPALGSGTAQAGSGGATLVTGRPADVPAYFEGHWVEIRDGATGELEGSFRVVAAAGRTLTLAPNAGETISVDPGDRWQGVYRFDSYSVRGNVPVESDDPIRVAGVQEITGTVTTREIVAESLVIRSGAVLTHPFTTDPAAPESLTIELTGELVIEAGGVIDVSGRGFARDVTWPATAVPANNDSGGSHIGLGGRAGAGEGTTYGSVYRPQEPGAGGRSSAGDRGGGVVRIVASGLTLADATSVIRANGVVAGSCCRRGGAGGSVWITTGTIAGDGVIQALGGNGKDGSGSGGGGAVAVDYTASSGTVLDHLQAFGGASSARGGAGSVYLFGPGATYGDLVISNAAIAGNRTVLPALGGGVAQTGSGGALLVTDRPAGVPAYFVGHWVEIRDAASGELRGTFRVAAVNGAAMTLDAGGGSVQVTPGDLWQGVYRFDNLTVEGTVPVDSEDPIRVGGTQEIRGLVEMREITAGNLTVKTGATLTHPFTPSATAPESLTIELSGALVIEPGAAIDVSGRGFARDVAWPATALPANNDSGGSHIGLGGKAGAGEGTTYGSVYRPQEPGAGGRSSAGDRGGGVVRIVASGLTLVDATSVIRANGVVGGSCCRRGGAGGSVWITTGTIAGDGVIQALGGNGKDGSGSGGGGAVAVEYAASSGTVLDHLQAFGGATSARGGAGSVYLFGPQATYGDLIVDAGPVAGNRTVLPALGGGVAQPGTGGSFLVTERETDVPAYFVGHWVEVRDGATGVLEGTFRVGSVTGRAITLVPGAGETLQLLPGDLWQGVYRFDNFTAGGTLAIDSADPIRVTGGQRIRGFVELREVVAGDLTVETGATLTHPFTPGSSPESLSITLAGNLVIEAGGAIDVSGRGLAHDVAWPGTPLPANSSAGGNHLGLAGLTGAGEGATFGSVYRPREPGAGGRSSAGDRGGGVVRIVASSLTLTDPTSVIRANGVRGGGCCRRAGGGGSVWITTGAIGGDGVIEAGGGPGRDGGGSGGGGAIAVEYGAASGTVLDHLRAFGGEVSPVGGAGTVHLFGPTSTYGDLVVDGGPVAGNRTVLPALGGGVAQPGSAGALLTTDRASDVPAYFEGHWVEIRSSDGTLEGTFRVASVDGVAVTLAGGGTPSVDPGDLWQGVYRFDDFATAGTALVDSADPIRLTGTQEIRGTAELREVRGAHLTLRAGATLTHPFTPSAAAPESLTIELTGDLVIEAGAAIDVSGRGFAHDVTWPGAALAANSGAGGSHLGLGGFTGFAEPVTFGSVYRPQEPGAGGRTSSGGRGGGVVTIVARSVTLADAASAIRANGVRGGGCCRRGGAGGSVWIATDTIAGEGAIEASGGLGRDGDGSGGGGAIAVEYGQSSGTVLDHLQAFGGNVSPTGGAGTIYLFGDGSVDGDLVVDNGGFAGPATVLPSLGAGTAQAGSGGALLTTDRATDVPAYFVGHWVELRDAGGALKDFYRVAAVDGLTVTLASGSGDPVAVAEGDQWQGVYRFDQAVALNGGQLASVDPVLGLASQSAPLAGKAARPNAEAPRLDPAGVRVAVGRVDGSYRVDVEPGAVADADGVAELRLADGASWMARPWSQADGASFLWPGAPGRRLTLTAFDDHPLLRRGRDLRLAPLPEGGWTAPRFTLPDGERPRHAAAGDGWVALAERTLRLFDAATGEVQAEVFPPAGGERVIALAAADGLLAAARSRRLEIVDREGGFRTLPVAAGAEIVDLAAGDGELFVLLRSVAEGGENLRWAVRSLDVDEASPLLPSAESFALPAEVFSRWRLHRLADGSLLVAGSGADAATPDAVFSWPRGAPPEAEPAVRALDGGWRIGGTWERGVVLTAGSAARLFELDGDWRQTARLDLGGGILAVAGRGDRLAFVLPGEVRVFDVGDPAAPRPIAHVAGSAHRSLEVTTEILLWSPGFEASPVVLETAEWPEGGAVADGWESRE